MPQVAAGVTSFLVGAGASTAVATAIGSIASNLLLSVAASALQAALMGQGEQPAPSGIRTRTTTAGDSSPQTIILGTYATAGNHVCPPMTHGRVAGADTPNAWLTYVIDVGDAPAAGLAGLWINDEKVTLGPVEPAGALYPDHRRVQGGKYDGKVWVRFYDGTQTTASESLTTIGGQDRPWTADMVGRGIPYAIIRFEYHDQIFRGQPTVLPEVQGIRLYDPRRDSSVGGSGTQRWNDWSTWTYGSENPAVQIYNILRGITLPDGTRWGGDAEAADLPLANWFAAMNECDRVVDGEPQYRASTEVRIGPENFGGQEPAAVIEELLRCCSGQISEYGGVWKMRAGPVGMPLFVLTDDDIIISEDQTFEPFPGLEATYNGVHAQYPEPAEKWVSKEAPPRYSATYEAQDDNRRLVASLSLGACPYPKQVQRLMRAYVEDERRHRRHVFTLPQDYAAVEPLDAGAWSSERNGYNAKVFEVGSKVDGARSLLQRMSVRERDPADYDWVPGYELPSTVNPVTTLPFAPQAVPGWSVAATTIRDASGTARRPAIVLGWSPDVPDAQGLAYEVRVSGRPELAAAGTTQNFAAGGLVITEGVLPNTQMQARGRLVARRATAWTAWTNVTTPNVGITDSDFVGGIKKLFSDQGLYAIEYFDTLPTTGNFVGRLVFLTTDGKLYRWTGTAWEPAVSASLDRLLDETDFAQGITIPRVHSTLPTTGNFVGRLAVLSTDGKLYRWTGTAWTAAVPAVDVTGQLTNAQIADIAAAKLTGQITEAQIASGAISGTKFASSIKPVEVLGALPGTPHTAGRMVFLTTDQKLYRNTGSGWTAAVPAADISGQVTAAQIAALEASKITGQITGTQISDNAISAPKISAGAVIAGKIAADAVTAGTIAANAVTAGKIAANAVTATTIAADAVTTGKIQAGAVTATEIAANAITAGKIAANAVTAVKISAGAVETEKLAAGAVTADTIAANAVTAAKVNAGAITASKIATNAITSDKIEANAITTAKIAAGAVAADQIAAGAIVASKLAVTDWTNLVPDDQIQDPAAWTISAPAGNVVHLPAAGENNAFVQSKGAWHINAAGANETFIASRAAPAKPGEEFRYTARTWSEFAGATVYTALQFLNAAFVETGRIGSTASTAGWTQHSGNLPAPAGTAWVRTYVSMPVSGYAGGYHLWSAPTIRRRLTGELVVDGTITGDKIVANTITGGLLATAGVITTAAQITNGIITNAKIANLAVDELKITDGAVSNFGIGGSTTLSVSSGDYLLSYTIVPVGNYYTRALIAYEASFASDPAAYPTSAYLNVWINGTIAAQTPIAGLTQRYFNSVVGRQNIAPLSNGTLEVALRIVGANGRTINFTNLAVGTWRR